MALAYFEPLKIMNFKLNSVRALIRVFKEYYIFFKNSFSLKKMLVGI